VEESLIYYEMKSIFKLLLVKDVLPSFLPIRNIRTFKELCRYFIFPFMLLASEKSNEDGSNSNQVSPSSPIQMDSIGGSNTQSQTISGPHSRTIELWGRSPGLFSK
jgi:hypothetical protein